MTEVKAAGGGDMRWTRPTMPGCLAPLRDGTVLLARHGAVERFDPATGRLDPGPTEGDIR